MNKLKTDKHRSMNILVLQTAKEYFYSARHMNGSILSIRCDYVALLLKEIYRIGTTR